MSVCVGRECCVCRAGNVMYFPQLNVETAIGARLSVRRHSEIRFPSNEGCSAASDSSRLDEGAVPSRKLLCGTPNVSE